MDSQLYWTWNLLFPLLLVYYIYIMPLIIASHNLELFVHFHFDSKSSRVLVAVGFVIDIIFNLISEQNVTEVKKGVLLKDSALMYLRKYFLADILAAFFAIYIAFADEEFLSECIFSNLFSTFCENDELDLSAEQQNTIAQYHSKFGDKLAKFKENSTKNFFLQLLLYSRFFIFVKFVQIDRIVGYIRKYREVIEELPFLSNQNNVDVIISMVLMVCRILLIIHCVSCLWMYFSGYVFDMFRHAFIDFLYLSNINSGN